MYADDIKRNTANVHALAVEDFRRMSPGLSGYFARWWHEQREIWRRVDSQESEPISEESVRSIFSFLACSLGPLMLDDLLQLLMPRQAVSRRQLRDSMAPLARFVIGDGKETGFTFSHPQMAEYFREEELT